MLALMFLASSCSDEQNGSTGEEARPETREVTRTVTVAQAPEESEPSVSESEREARAPSAEQAPDGEAVAEDSPEDVLDFQYRLINAGDYEGAYTLFAERSKQLVSPEQYRAYFESNAPYSITDYSFPSVVDQGDSAIVEAALTVSSASGLESYQRAQEMVREGGVWRAVMRDEQVSAFVAGGASSGTGESAQYEPEAPPEREASEPADEEIGEISVLITGDPGISFSGNIGTLDGSRSVEGTTPQEFAVEVDTGALAFDSVSVTAQNSDGSGNLVVQILRDGEVVKEQSTTAQYGVASVNWSPSE